MKPCNYVCRTPQAYTQVPFLSLNSRVCCSKCPFLRLFVSKHSMMCVCVFLFNFQMWGSNVGHTTRKPLKQDRLRCTNCVVTACARGIAWPIALQVFDETPRCFGCRFFWVGRDFSDLGFGRGRCFFSLKLTVYRSPPELGQNPKGKDHNHLPRTNFRKLLVSGRVDSSWGHEIPSWELTYLIPRHFWRWVSSSPGGIC